MNFKEKIEAHQQGKYDFTTELLELALSDMVKTTMICTQVEQEFYNEEDGHYTLTFNRWRPKYTVKKNTAEYRMARNIKIWIARYTKKANGMRKKYLFEGSQHEIYDGDALHTIYSTFVEHGFHYHKDDFDKVPAKVWDKIGKGTVYQEFMEFRNILPAINRAKSKLVDQYTPIILESLNEVLPSVDLSREEDEIIGFIAISTKRKVDRKLTKLLGTKVHNINGEKYYVTKEDIRKNKFIKTKADNVLKINVSKLTSNQLNFYFSLKDMIQKEINAINIEPFTFDIDGNIIGFNKRFFASQMDMKESTFKNRLKRIQTKSKLADDEKLAI
ncbi:hypothetical protein [Planococcus halotolerans]|uniref:Uncharacterized protein n=1 Tax=Planococcus halotolerans TaxID=2233542 RepID=A0A365KLW9_9BACL|nr:hypothetical protein [Planococcus halotolerans]QHJ71632.1 hypothetical protein DNR44_013780 [Planococcus halotolerans]RAZ74151.1 hypothetical protein DP120_16360 [Planococcus halotolerans]